MLSLKMAHTVSVLISCMSVSQLACFDELSPYTKWSRYLCIRAWLSGLPRQKFWRKTWAAFITFFMFLSSFSWWICSNSSTTVWAPMFFSRSCSCLAGPELVTHFSVSFSRMSFIFL
ncbi:hypothetical protein NP493_759g00005 [Ridgeia piscesae]|uniref:Uncharacterized protein n=1 Tax=Ridgeia piscesae TaxID=27915 RepID=A0AAD9KNU9_RIDPI|nr:hypothetical protein NP493_759g00005 [Ridgeia piscesae]